MFHAPAQVPTTLGFTPLDDHARLPARFFGRLFARRAVLRGG
jgi:hypothetical protein